MTQIGVSSIPGRVDGPNSLIVKPALAYTWMGMNSLNEKLTDVRIRRAIQQAINTEEVVLATFGDAVKPSFGVVPPPLLGARDKLLYPYDPEASKALLAEAGAQGLQLKIEFGTDADLLVAAQIIQAQLAAVGITLDVRQVDGSALTAQQQDTEGGSWQTIELFFSTFTTAPRPELGHRVVHLRAGRRVELPAHLLGRVGHRQLCRGGRDRRCQAHGDVHRAAGPARRNRRLRVPLPRRQRVGVPARAEGRLDARRAVGAAARDHHGLTRPGLAGATPAGPSFLFAIQQRASR